MLLIKKLIKARENNEETKKTERKTRKERKNTTNKQKHRRQTNKQTNRFQTPNVTSSKIRGAKETIASTAIQKECAGSTSKTSANGETDVITNTPNGETKVMTNTQKQGELPPKGAQAGGKRAQ